MSKTKELVKFTETFRRKTKKNNFVRFFAEVSDGEFAWAYWIWCNNGLVNSITCRFEGDITFEREIQPADLPIEVVSKIKEHGIKFTP